MQVGGIGSIYYDERIVGEVFHSNFITIPSEQGILQLGKLSRKEKS